MKRTRQSGFTLIELVMVIVIVAVAAIPLLGRFSQVAGSTLLDEEIQTAAQLVQARAEAILALRRDQGYAAVVTGTRTDTLSGSYSAYTRTVTVTEPPPGGGCPIGATCKGVVVDVSRGLATRAQVSLVLVNY